MVSGNAKGLTLAVVSSVFIVTSFILKKKGLKRAAAARTRAVSDRYTVNLTNFINVIPYMEGSEDRLLPIANVGRIMKQALPLNAKISKGTKERMQECATEFISFVTSEAADRCRKDNRKTLNGEDICGAMNALGLVNLGESTTRYLHKFRKFESEKQQLNQLQNEDPILVAHPPESRDQYHEELITNVLVL